MDIQKEREAFNKEFGIDDADTFPAFSGGIENSAALKCNWLGWKKRAEFEYRENPETIKIDGLKTIHKLCKFGADHNMGGCTFTEIVERMFDEIVKAQAVLEVKPSRHVTLTCAQLREAFMFGAPDKDDQEQLETEMTITWSENGHNGKGYYCYYSDLPEEGAIFLDDVIEAQEQSNDLFN